MYQAQIRDFQIAAISLADRLTLVIPSEVRNQLGGISWG